VKTHKRKNRTKPFQLEGTGCAKDLRWPGWNCLEEGWEGRQVQIFLSATEHIITCFQVISQSSLDTIILMAKRNASFLTPAFLANKSRSSQFQEFQLWSSELLRIYGNQWAIFHLEWLNTTQNKTHKHPKHSDFFSKNAPLTENDSHPWLKQYTETTLVIRVSTEI
jgi:hypothetical protein